LAYKANHLFYFALLSLNSVSITYAVRIEQTIWQHQADYLNCDEI